MPVNKPRRNGSFAPLSAQAYKDDALMEAGEAAELLFYRGVSFGADVLQDGVITEAQLIRFVGHGMKDAKKRAEKLVKVGVWTRVEGGYSVRSWLKWNRSKEEIDALQNKDAVRKPKRGSNPDGDEPLPDEDSERNPLGDEPESAPDTANSPNGTGVDSEPRARPPSLQPTPEPENTLPTAPRRARVDGDFEAFWEIYPRKVGKDAARRAWVKVVKTTSSTQIIQGAKTFAVQREGEDPQYTAYPATWLNAGRWDDEPPQPTHGGEDFQLPTPPREVADDPDPAVYVRWARAQRDAWVAAHTGRSA